MTDKKMRLYISIPSNRTWKCQFGTALASMCAHLTASKVEFKIHNITQASCLSASRQAFVDEMIAEEYTHWLSLDDDMTFPHDVVQRLLKHDKDIVTCNARAKQNELKGSIQSANNEMLLSNGKTGIEQIHLMGGAVFLAKIDKFKHIPKPHFQVLWIPQANQYMGEDNYFAYMMLTNGVEMWCDHDTSQLIGHVGDSEYRWPQSATPTLVEQLKDIAPEHMKVIDDNIKNYSS